MLVGDVIGVASLAAGLSLGATGLDSKLLAPGLELVHGLGGPAGEVHMDGGPHSSSQVGGAGVDVSVLLGAGVVLASLNLDGLSDSLDTASLLHGDDAGLVLLVDPHEEGLGVIVEDSTEMMRDWSSSLTHMRKVLASLWKIPRPSGQSRSIPATVRFLSPDTKRKWSSTSCCLTASSMPVRG